MKKPSVVSFLITLLLAAAVCTHGEEFVTDKDGNPVEFGVQYFIQAVQTEYINGGGVVPDISIFFPPLCPLNITLNPNQPGLPVIFGYTHSIEPYVPISTYPVTIEFKSDFWPGCSKFWKLDASSSTIVIAGTPKELTSWFAIGKAGEAAGANTYKLTTYIGLPVGIKPRPIGAPLLVVTNFDDSKTLLFKFSKVDAAATATTSTSRVDKLGLRMFPFY